MRPALIRKAVMTELTSFPLGNDLRVTVETPAAPGLAPTGLRPAIIQSEHTLRQALQPVTAAASEVIEKFRDLPSRPDEVEIHFGVKLDGTLGAVIATAGIGTHLGITLRWNHPGAAGPAEGAAEGTAGGPG
jgi:hypothetical protein